MKKSIVQGSLFGDKKTVSSPALNITSGSSSFKKMDLSLLGGLDRAQIKGQEMLLLRTIAGKFLRSFPSDDSKAKRLFLECITHEIQFKKGELPPLLLLRDLFLKMNKPAELSE